MISEELKKAVGIALECQKGRMWGPYPYSIRSGRICNFLSRNLPSVINESLLPAVWLHDISFNESFPLERVGQEFTGEITEIVIRLSTWLNRKTSLCIVPPSPYSEGKVHAGWIVGLGGLVDASLAVDGEDRKGLIQMLQDFPAIREAWPGADSMTDRIFQKYLHTLINRPDVTY